MKLPSIMDAEDVGILAKGVILAGLGAGGLVVAAGALGLAWTVFKVVGGL